MITQWVWTCAFIRDSHFPLISSPVIKSSEMDLGNCTVDCHVGLGKMNKVISFVKYTLLIAFVLVVYMVDMLLVIQQKMQQKKMVVPYMVMIMLTYT